MAKITVEVAAKRLGMDPDECLKRLQEMGIMVRDQLDKIDTEVFQQVKAHLDEEKLRAAEAAASTTKRVGNRVIRRRRVRAEEEGAEEVADEAVEPEVAAAPPVEEFPEPVIEEPVEAPAVQEEPAPVEEPGEPDIEEPAAPEAAPAEEVVVETPPAPPAPAQEGSAFEHVKPKRIDMRDLTHEPAKILSRPKIPVEPIKPAAPRPAPAPAPGEPPKEARPGATDRRERKGRRVVDFAERGRRKEEDREDGFLRNRRGKKKKQVKHTEITTPKQIKRKVKVGEQITVGDLAKRLGVKGGDLVKRLLGLGMMVTINQDIDFDTSSILAQEFGFEVEQATMGEEGLMQLQPHTDTNLQFRPPVVTVMGHVDHGKTTLLDAIRETDVAGGEAGGITQHIGAYSVKLKDGRFITFVDTPGHESFANMRARGAHVTDIVILVVAADDGVMPQTIESINHAKEAGVPIVVAVNKIDKDNANQEKITRQLMDYGLIPEHLGGDTLFVPISAKKRIGIEDVLEAVLLQAEVMDLKADPDRLAEGVVLDARLERGRGPVADVLVRHGTLNKGDFIVADTFSGRVRMMFDDKGVQLDRVGPGVPAEVIGLNGVPRAGMVINAVDDEKKAKAVVNLRETKVRSEELKKRASIRLEDLYAKAQEGKIKALKVVVKCDVHGSVEAVRDSLLKLGNDKIQTNVIHAGVGTITETDVNFASASEAVIIGFNVKPEAKGKELAEQLGVEIKTYTVIYELIAEVTAALEGMLEPTLSEVLNGVAEVRNTFRISKAGVVAGCYVLEGKIIRNSKARLLRNGEVVHTGNLGSLKRFKDDAREVASGFECGINFEGFNDIEVGDKIESFSVVETRDTL